MNRKIFTYTVFLMCFILHFSIFPIQTEASSLIPKYAGVVKTSYGKLNVRSSPSTNAAIADSLQSGSYVSIISESGSFYRVSYKNSKIGYCHKDYIIKQTGSYGAYVNTSSTSLNVRSGPGTNYSIKTTLPKNEKVVVLSSSGTFLKILYKASNIGYASSAYIKANTDSASNSSKISLNIPSYKQFDSRWKDTRLGNSTKTISQAGCLTTAVAMEKSFHYGYSITPNNVARSEKYTSEGSLYWPSEYTFIYYNDLTKYKNLVSKNTPIIVGSKNSYGSQHWIIITGYIANGNISADDFTINDPGSNTRKTLQNFYSSFPYFYKAAYRA